ncbi:MAG: hypothetical protein ABI823_15215, partial [Bryobacteraceae bacterium]
MPKKKTEIEPVVSKELSAPVPKAAPARKPRAKKVTTTETTTAKPKAVIHRHKKPSVDVAPVVAAKVNAFTAEQV